REAQNRLHELGEREQDDDGGDLVRHGGAEAHADDRPRREREDAHAERRQHLRVAQHEGLAGDGEGERADREAGEDGGDRVEQRERDDRDELAQDDPAAARLEEDRRGQRAVSHLARHRERAEDDGEDVAERHPDRVDELGALDVGKQHLLALDVGRRLGREHQGEADDGGEERDEDHLAHEQDPPHAGGADLAQLGQDDGAHAATSSEVDSAWTAVRRRNTSSSESPLVDSSWSSRPSAKAADPTSAADTPTMCASPAETMRWDWGKRVAAKSARRSP